MAWTNEDITSLRIANVSDDERAVIQELLARWNDRLSRNVQSVAVLRYGAGV